jgi:hypothetical protein
MTLTLDIGGRESARAFILDHLRCLDADGALEQAMMAEAIRSAVLGETFGAACDRRALLFVALNARWRADLVHGRELVEPLANMQARTHLIDDLLSAGDISLDSAASFLPAPLRAIRLDENVQLLVGSVPTSRLLEELPSVRAAGLLRITNGCDGSAELPMLSMDDWLGLPASDRHHSNWLARFERCIVAHLRPIPPGDPARWQALARADAARYRFGPLPASPPGGLILCRHATDGQFAQGANWIVRLERREEGVRPAVGVEIDRSTGLRFRFAMQARAGVPARAQLFQSPSQVRLRYTWRFPEPESKILHAGTLVRTDRIPDVIFRSEFVPVLHDLYTTLGVAVELHDAN